MTPGEGNALELAARRLERAVSQLEQKITAERTARLAAFSAAASAASSGAAPGDPGLFDVEAESKAARLVADLEAARAREKALEEAGEQASEALGRAIAEIRAALGDESLITEGVHDEEEDLGDEGPEAGDLFDLDDGVTEREA
ncbi:hypothetical protein ASD21_06400 [Caulobacter sp. Root1455]|uniref:hypothetical protein n=1 Tax=Caulobacter sp. Root1455 TaxID=1736465 RepID=UPI0006F26E81|nr:hypothetical protein [Caulobacter sp. Root1455]KQY96129.1 hypothetical protein ASD21_06400 [Caulobacter sp. Root1455]